MLMRASQNFIKVINQICKDRLNIEFENREWLDPDFQEFGIYHCTYKGWKFGFWFTSKDSSRGPLLSVNAFAMPLINIDKFKPSRAEFSEEWSALSLAAVAGKESNTTKMCNLYDELNYTRIINMIEFIVKHPIDAFYIDLVNCGDKYYRLPNKLKTVFTVYCYKFKCWFRQFKEILEMKRCQKFIEKKLTPLFNEENNTKLNWEYRENWSPAFNLRVTTIDKLYSVEELNRYLNSDYAELLVAKWNSKLKWYSDNRLTIEYEAISEENQRTIICSSSYIEDYKKFKKELKKDNIGKKVYWTKVFWGADRE